METYLVLLRVGFTLPLLLPVARCALTAPFHPYLCSRTNHRRSSLCCTGRRLSPPRCYLALYPVEPGLSSALHPYERKRTQERSTQRLPGQLGRDNSTAIGMLWAFIGCWTVVSGSGVGLRCWALVLGSAVGLWCWALVLGSGVGLWCRALVSGSGVGLRCRALVSG